MRGRAAGLALFLIACGGDFPKAPDAGPAQGGADAPPTQGTAPTTLPFAVDDWYGPSGYMGDGEQPGAIADAMTCIDARPTSWIGKCHRYTWTPGTKMWAGVYWQYPDGNWGAQAGLPLPPGATKVAFRAWGATGTETVDFMVGMMAADGFQLQKTGVALTKDPQQYEIPLGGTAYAKVVGGFGWVAKNSTTPVTFSVDDIRWE